MSKTRSQKNRRKKVKRKGRNVKQSIPFWLAVILVIGLVYFFAIFLLSSPITSNETVQEDTTKEDFIQRLLPHAKELQQREGILPSIIMGQAILESDWGQSELSQKYNNLFGMKAYGEGEKVSLSTMEYENGKWIEIKANFKVYPNWEASMDDHTLLFKSGVSWNPKLYQEVLQATNYQEAAVALQKAGYATDPTYQKKIIEVIEAYQLQQYDEKQ